MNSNSGINITVLDESNISLNCGNGAINFYTDNANINADTILNI